MVDNSIITDAMQQIDDINQGIASNLYTQAQATGFIRDIIRKQPRDNRAALLNYLRQSRRFVDREAARLYGVEEDVA